MTSASWSMMLVVSVNAILFHAMPASAGRTSCSR